MMHRSPVLTVDLNAIAANYALLKTHFSGPECAAVVKADAYGLGAVAVAQKLQGVGCKRFFVATLDEALQLRSVLQNSAIHVFHGPYAGEEAEYKAQGIIPVINHGEQMERWLKAGEGAAFALHVDTGMTRLGLTQGELEMVIERFSLPVARCQLLLSHLACAIDPDDSKNAQQLARMRKASALLPGVPVSFCNSSGVFLPSEYHFALARPGCALYGINPTPKKPNPMQPVVRLTAPILQLRITEVEETIGYNATATVPKGAKLATVQLGYADGYPRLLSSCGCAYIGEYRVEVLGRVSMDMIVVDASHVPEAVLASEHEVEIIGARQTVDDIAREASTIGYEILTGLENRIQRDYIG